MSGIPLVLRLLNSNELEEGAILVARAMRDNPANTRVFRIADSAQRSLAMGRFFVPVLGGLYQRGLVLGAVRADRLVGVCGMARPGFCQPGTIEKTRVFPAAVIGNPIPTPLRVLSWVGEWARRDPPEPHWHLGPMAVDPEFQGCGIGTAMLHTFCAVADSTGASAYLETDKSENVRLYQRFGFHVMESAEVLGIPNWFMFRAASTEAKTQSSLATGLLESRAAPMPHPTPASAPR
jgi:ribosomal protein S18 acetylase RimI-like enzyme